LENKYTCIGAGLVALDVIFNYEQGNIPKLSVGGSCGNVLSILSYLGWNSYPIARLAKNQATIEVLNDLERWQIQKDYISITEEGSTPIIIHRILKDKAGLPIHRFEFRDPLTKSWLPQFKPITKNTAAEVIENGTCPRVFYFDRMNPGTYDLISYYKSKGTIIYFEPSSDKDLKQFERFLALADIVKFSHDRIPHYKERYSSNQCFLEVETHGKEGLLYRSKNNSTPSQWNALAAFPLKEVNDAAGAGDWCSAGIITKLGRFNHEELQAIEEADIIETLKYGQLLGTINCLYEGARGLMYFYSKQELSSIMDNYKLSTNNYWENQIKRVPIIEISKNLTISDLY
jgi:fructokinase